MPWKVKCTGSRDKALTAWEGTLKFTIGTKGTRYKKIKKSSTPNNVLKIQITLFSRNHIKLFA